MNELTQSFPPIETLDIPDDEYDNYILRSSRSVKQIKKVKRKKKATNPIDEKKKKVAKDTKLDLQSEKPCPDNEWLSFCVYDDLARALVTAGYKSPTEVQKNSLIDLIKIKKDSVVAAETGSGKTLLYIIPILQKCLQIKYHTDDTNHLGKLRCLILTPTRELAIQVKNMTNKISKPLEIFCVDIIGGLSEIKQERLLSKRPQILVGTPGRLWTYIEQYPHDHLHDLSGFKLLVIDEVDRMTEEGHFKQLSQIIGHLDKINKSYVKYVISATLGVKVDKTAKCESFYKVSKIVDVKKCIVHDFTNKSVTPDSLKEYKLFCDDKQLNLMLYLILLKSGKTLIFVPSIKVSDWLNIFLNNLNIFPLKLNSKMDQKNRLKLFDKFNSTNSIMIATDVASRGLDFPDIETIVHYNVPTNPDIYVHRSGRTARQFKCGSSVLIVNPSGVKYYHQIVQSLNREKDMEEYDVDLSQIKRYQNLIHKCSELTDKCFQIRKWESCNRWFKEKSIASETIIDPYFVKSSQPDEKTLKLAKSGVEKQKKYLQSELLNINHCRF
ncbi:DEAD-box ATP-dependent RNA helicase 13 [Thelohanellus kitauei]|uniref:ATP-dependent RNA helicase n=1 Tax=Thelohanellus kitauei TaxID=669202 RepID=A0A0C2N0H8_THEKT|nr:DEAD-box ATP-dependent RNA helicase 13 [Thelohanellus kitauei]